MTPASTRRPRSVEVAIQTLVDVGPRGVQQLGRELVGPAEVRRVPQLRSPELDEIRISLDLIHNRFCHRGIGEARRPIEGLTQSGHCCVMR